MGSCLQINGQLFNNANFKTVNLDGLSVEVDKILNGAKLDELSLRHGVFVMKDDYKEYQYSHNHLEV